MNKKEAKPVGHVIDSRVHKKIVKAFCASQCTVYNNGNAESCAFLKEFGGCDPMTKFADAMGDSFKSMMKSY